jgi:hypothetical protein
MYQLSFYVPETHLETVKTAVFTAGAGKIGTYEKCCWQTPGAGQYQPSTGSDPYQGTADKLETVNEYKVELVVAEDKIKPVCDALLRAHPYETPAYHYIKVQTIDDLAT